ncbi:hypothetical protein PIB30_036831 [Stylosanthes scabra]|uniref:Ubiquitin-like protease family profile domain-containing protein n=1 Tax=Stylosanthes scabra TaxID=79078 RepID=A0ABU6RDM3_9FABA|nr:hypothetical protein [Stylosanthes scabra]
MGVEGVFCDFAKWWATATRKVVEAQGREIRELKKVTKGNNDMLQILWVEYVKGRKQSPLEKGDAHKLASIDEALHADLTEEDLKEDLPAKEAGTVSLKKHSLKRKLDYSLTEEDGGVDMPQDPDPKLMLVYGPNTPGYIDGGDLPKCMDVVFRPPVGVRFMLIDLVMAGYVFARGMSQRETIVPYEHGRGDRRTFWSLRPSKELYDDVLNMLAKNLTISREDKRIWWLPTTFAQFALSPESHCKDTFEYIKRVHIGKADQLTKIFVPLHLGRHWYLMIVHIRDKELIYLDSRKCDEVREARVKQMIDVVGIYLCSETCVTLSKNLIIDPNVADNYFLVQAKFINNMLKDRSFYLEDDTVPPTIDTFGVVEPPVSQQCATSKDCGVWVAQWMEFSRMWGSYDL